MVRVLLPVMLGVAVVLACAARATTYGDINDVVVVSVYDGDTLSVNVPDWPPVVGQRVPVRVRGIDASESHHDAGRTRRQSISQCGFD